MLQNISKNLSAVTFPATEPVTESAKTPAAVTTYTAWSYGDAARALGAAIASQYRASTVVAVSTTDREAARKFGDALSALATLSD